MAASAAGHPVDSGFWLPGIIDAWAARALRASMEVFWRIELDEWAITESAR